MLQKGAAVKNLKILEGLNLGLPMMKAVISELVKHFMKYTDDADVLGTANENRQEYLIEFLRDLDDPNFRSTFRLKWTRILSIIMSGQHSRLDEFLNKIEVHPRPEEVI